MGPRMMKTSEYIDRFFRAVAGLGLLLSLCTLGVSESSAMDIAILRSSDIAAYREAIAGLKTAGPLGAIYTEYDVQGDLDLGKKLARKLRASNASLVVAVGLKAALAAKVEIVDVTSSVPALQGSPPATGRVPRACRRCVAAA